MAMDITGLSNAQGSNGRGTRINNEQQNTPGNAGGSVPAQPSVHQGSPDTVKISDAAQAIQGAAQKLESEPDVNSDRVAELKAAIDSGEYKVDAERVADRMLAFDSLFS
ncbi:flagellar biosynthesis anti-sigma factor FlgM [Marinobacterium lutimaris]|uniref:Negative regulator of flagellin synthesis n=1 Tax=Marinobacterium lutimaris TaxID=568106 RepID=A0A1H6BDI4_9GAMM|nr:flagellar biosynthesis anti-sigma factor FlgM [Marinobacterium lutimaris]SEG58839.1 anti-sigma-28 factor, FlgM family [Marinobacterium lutimaris]